MISFRAPRFNQKLIVPYFNLKYYLLIDLMIYLDLFLLLNCLYYLNRHEKVHLDLDLIRLFVIFWVQQSSSLISYHLKEGPFILEDHQDYHI